MHHKLINLATSQNSSIERTKNLTKIQLVVNLLLAIFLMAMENSRTWLEAKVKALEEKVDALTEQTHTKKG